jgi:hypothetical protein
VLRVIKNAETKEPEAVKVDNRRRRKKKKPHPPEPTTTINIIINIKVC